MAQKSFKIRFIERERRGVITYVMQRKVFFFGWIYITREIGGSPAGVAIGPYEEKSKDELLDWVLSEVYRTEKKYVNIIEYPMIRQY